MTGGGTGGGTATGGGTGTDAGADAGTGFASCELSFDGGAACSPGFKCTWVIEAQTPPSGSLRCVPAGSVANAGACSRGDAGAETGFDNCADGLVCINNVCRAVCELANTASCGAQDACTRYANLFSNEPEVPLAGACVEGCDPLTQRTSSGGTCGAGKGCYLVVNGSITTAICATAGTVAHGAAITGTAYANVCVPGASARRPSSGSTALECGGFCKPAEVTSNTNTASEGGVDPDSCQTRWGAAAPSDAAGESCHYYYLRESDGATRFSNSLGFCFKHAAFQYDTNGDGMPDAPWPRCTTLTTGDVVPPFGEPPHNDAQYFGCVEQTTPKRNVSVLRAPTVAMDRVTGWR